jgi:ubiquinone/menaquinone biosynthesis C-methylase UbiE
LSRPVADVVRFGVPWTAAVALVGARGAIPDLPGAAHLRDAAAAREWLAALPAERSAYAVAVDSSSAAALGRDYRLVVREPGVCEVFALRSKVAARETPARDGLPFPPPEMVQLVAGIERDYRFYQRFISGGQQTAERLRGMLAQAGPALERMEAVLDFGCGCGRVMRHWKDLHGPRLHGTDYNPYLVEWCRQNLPFAEFSVNGLDPGLDLPAEAFDLVYCYSVFTHLPEPLQAAWLAELVRVTAPGGHLWLTFHGEHAAGDLGEAEQSRFAAGELVVVMMRGDDDLGTNACAAYHPRGYVRDTLAASLQVVAFLPGDRDFIQDAYVLRKPPIS